MTKNELKMHECYVMWKGMWPKVKYSDLAEHFGVSLPAIYGWVKKPITIDGVKYDNFESALNAERKQVRDAYEKEINEQISEAYKLAEVWSNEILKKAIIQVRNEEYKPSLDEIKLAISVHKDLYGGNTEDSDIIGDAAKKIQFNLVVKDNQ